MTLKIVRTFDGERTILGLSGRIQSSNVEEIREQMKGHAQTIVLDLEEVTLVDIDGVRFLGACESQGIELRHCAPYIREWILRENARNDHNF